MRGLLLLLLLCAACSQSAFAARRYRCVGFVSAPLAFAQPKQESSHQRNSLPPLNPASRCTAASCGSGNNSKHRNGHVTAITALRMAGGGSAGSSPIGSQPRVNKVKNGEAEIGGSIFNLVKNIVGSGILALPGGVAAFSHSKGAVIPASILILLIGLLSGYCFSLIGRACAATNTTTYGDAWEKTVSPKTSWMPVVSVISKTFFACLSYSIIIGDTFTALANTFNAPIWLKHRPTILTAISSIVLLPLCLLKDLSPLRYTSIAGVIGTLYTAVVMALRYYDGSYAEGGRFFSSIGMNSDKLFYGSAALNPTSLILISMLSTSFIAHYNAPKFYHELKDKNIKKYNKVVSWSFMSSIVLFIAMTVYPYLTFGSSCKGFILNNYATNDKLATMCRLAIGASIVFGYPLTFITAREGVLTALKCKEPTNTQVKIATVGLLGVFTALAMVLRNLGFVVAFGGALLGSAVIYVFPAVMWVYKCKNDIANNNPPIGWKRTEYLANYGIIGLGSLLGLLGAIICVMKTFFL